MRERPLRRGDPLHLPSGRKLCFPGSAHLRDLPLQAERDVRAIPSTAASPGIRMNRRTLAGAACACCAALAFAWASRTSAPTRAADDAVARASVLPVAQPYTDDALGTVADVVADGRGRLFALDAQRRTVVLLAPDRSRGRTIGRPGRGPGEFVAPISMTLDSRGRLLVLDRGTLRIEAFRMGEDGAERVGALPLPFPAEDIVECGGRLFLLGSWHFNLIHEISAVDGQVLRSFAPDSVPADDLMAGYRSTGYLECGPGPALTFLPMLRPELTRFAVTTGAQIGRLLIPTYKPVQVSRTGDGGLMFRAPTGGHHDMASSLVTLPDGSQLVQVGVLEDGAHTRHEFREVRSFVVSWDAPSIRPADVALPRIMRAHADSLFAVDTDPAPRVTAVRIQLGSGERR